MLKILNETSLKSSDELKIWNKAINFVVLQIGFVIAAFGQVNFIKSDLPAINDDVLKDGMPNCGNSVGRNYSRIKNL